MPRGGKKAAETVDDPPIETVAIPSATGTGSSASATAIGTTEQASSVDNTGTLDVDATGDGGAREQEVSAAQERFDHLHEDLDLETVSTGSIVAECTAFVLEMFKHRPKPWDQLSQTEQRDQLSGIEDNVKEMVRQVVEKVRAEDTNAVRCLFVGFTDKGDDIKAELKVKARSREETEQAVLAMHRARGLHVLVTVASADDFHTEPARDESQPDQRPLGFEAGSDDHPADDSDLVAAAIPEGGKPPLPIDTTEVVKTGDILIHDRMGLCEARVNLKSAMLEVLVGENRDLDGSWSDVREASPAELAAERERTADFGQDEEVTETVEA